MSTKNQGQSVGEGSTAIQAAGNVTITSTGLSYSEVREVALDLFKGNFYSLVGIAQETAKSRAEEITDAFLSKLKKEHSAGIEQAQDPDFQYALFTVQKEYARTGDKDLGDLLVDLLVDRSKQEQRDIMSIVLTESLGIAPKLTENHLAVLAVVFLFRYSKNLLVGNHELLGTYFDKHVAPFVSKLVKNFACYQHLEFTGCGSIGVGATSLESIFARAYEGLFLKGVDENEVTKNGFSLSSHGQYFVQCLNNSSKLQVKALSQEQLEEMFEAEGCSIKPEDRSKIISLFHANRMNDQEIRDKVVQIRPFMADVFDIWSKSAMMRFTLTSVGIAIGHANIKRLVGEFADLSIWIN